MSQAMRLLDVAVSRQAGEVTLSWSDGRTQVLSLADLRRLCPCATCNDARAATNPLQVISGPLPSADLEGLDAVGAYALRFHWADGHSAGIYAHTYLRSLGES